MVEAYKWPWADWPTGRVEEGESYWRCGILDIGSILVRCEGYHIVDSIIVYMLLTTMVVIITCSCKGWVGEVRCQSRGH